MISTAFMLLFGDYFQLHKRVLAPLLRQPASQLGVRLWLNTVGAETMQWLAVQAPPTWVLYISDRNIPKYKAMRFMFHDATHPLSAPWVTWFDDDSVIVAGDWLPKALEFIQHHPEIDFFGRECTKIHMPGVEQWIMQSAWYRRRPFQRVGGQSGITFIQGSYWWLRLTALRAVDWPDPRLNHNGGDTALSEALWQVGSRQTGNIYGIDVDCAERRGLTEPPAGSVKEKAYKSDNSRPSMLGKMGEYQAILRSLGKRYQLYSPQLAVMPPVSMPPSPSMVAAINRLPSVMPARPKRPQPRPAPKARARLTLRQLIAARQGKR